VARSVVGSLDGAMVWSDSMAATARRTYMAKLGCWPRPNTISLDRERFLAGVSGV
jgi:hypothetical protein